MAAGALAATGRFSLVAVLGDLVWFELGKRRGESVLGLLCRISLEPDSCVKSTNKLFGRAGAYTILVSKFVPGLSTAAPPLAGMLGWRMPVFLATDFAGSLLWAGAFTGTGYMFHTQLERVAAVAARLGWWTGVVLIVSPRSAADSGAAECAGCELDSSGGD